mgnify:CR=1 FL=1
MKRMCDILITSLALMILALPLLLLVWVVYRKLGSPVFFQQVRPGLNGLPFNMVKFRTMNSQRYPDGYLLPDIERLTPFGCWLRSTSLDELPELWNVLKGEMSLVGPRPLLMEYLSLYNLEQARRHEVRPGITGWAQINGCRGEVRTHEEMVQRVNFDLYYIHRWSFTLDLQIILQTIIKMLRDKGAY